MISFTFSIPDEHVSALYDLLAEAAEASAEALVSGMQMRLESAHTTRAAVLSTMRGQLQRALAEEANARNAKTRRGPKPPWAYLVVGA